MLSVDGGVLILFQGDDNALFTIDKFRLDVRQLFRRNLQNDLFFREGFLFLQFLLQAFYL